MDKKLTISISRRSLKIALILAVVIAVLAPVAVIAAGGTFTDDDSSIFEGDIEWMAANGITSGCGTDIYCPDDGVTRGEMAAFMKRLATKKVVDAATALEADHAVEADHASDADFLEGWAGSYYLSPIYGTARDWQASDLTIDTAAGDVDALTLSGVTVRSGVLKIDYGWTMFAQAGARAYGNTWIQLDDTTCEFAKRIKGSTTYADESNAAGIEVFAHQGMTIATPIDSGTHTVTMCANSFTGTFRILDASITAIASTDGSASVPANVIDGVSANPKN